MGWGDVIVPGDEADSARDVDQSVGAVEDGECGLVARHEPMLNSVFGERKEETERTILLEFKDGETMGF